MTMPFKTILPVLTMVAAGFAPEAGAVPCGLRATLTEVGQNPKAFSPAVTTPEAVYNSFFYPSSYPVRPGVTPTQADTDAVAVGEFSGRRFKGPTAQYVGVAGYPTADDYYKWSSFEVALDAIRGKSATIPQIACSGTLTERISEIAGFFANIGQETSGASPTEANYTAGVAWNMSKYAEDNSWGVCPVGAVYLTGKDTKGNDVTVTGPGSTTVTMFACGKDATKAPDFSASSANPPIYTISNDNTKSQTGSRSPQYGIWYGRGPKQLTYWYNYQWASGALDVPGSVVYMNDPDELLTNPSVGWETALAYQLVRYKEPGTTYTKPAMHDVFSKTTYTAYEASHTDIVKKGPWGFGQTINLLNGGVECNQAPTYRTLSRMNNYIELMIRMGVDVTGVEIKKTDSTTISLSRAELDQNIYDRNETYSWQPHGRRWITAPLPMNFYSSPPTGQYFLHYKDSSNQSISERIDCSTGFTPY